MSNPGEQSKRFMLHLEDHAPQQEKLKSTWGFSQFSFVLV
jgi:hypothetical protein